MTPNMKIQPYVAKQFKVISTETQPPEKDKMSLYYVEPISDTDKKDIEFIIETDIVFEKQISIEEFNQRFQKEYEEVAINQDETKKIENPKIATKTSTEAKKIEAEVKKKEETKKLDIEARKQAVKDKLEKIKADPKPVVPEDRKIKQLTYAADDKPETPVMTMNDMLKEIPLKLLTAEIRRRQLAENLKGKLIVSGNQVNFTLDELKWPVGVYEIDISLTKDITDEYIEEQKKKQEKQKVELLTEGTDK